MSGGYDHADQFAVEVGPDREDLENFASDPNKGLERAYFSGDFRYNLGEGYVAQPLPASYCLCFGIIPLISMNAPLCN